MLDLYETVPFRLYIASQSKKGMPTAGYFFVSFFKVNPWTLLDLLVCVQPAPQVNYDMQRYQLPYLFQASLGLPCPGLLLRPRYIIFKYRKWWLDCSSGLWSFPPSWPNPTDTSLFLSYVAVSSFLEHSPRLAFVISLSLLTFRISVDLSFFSTVVSVSSLFHMWLLLRAQFYSPSSCLHSFLPFLNMLAPGGLIIPNV